MKNVLIVGVGGQGSLLASQLLGNLYLARGLAVKVNEVHGMSQRGGSVVTTVRAGERVDSPVIVPGTADLLISFEQLEAQRWAHFLSPEGKLVASTQKILPMPVISGVTAYPPGITERCKGLWIDATAIAAEAGNVRCSNVALLGAASVVMDFSQDEWTAALSAVIKPALLEVNLKAFALGRAAAGA